MTKARVLCLTIDLRDNLNLRSEVVSDSKREPKKVIKLPYYSDNKNLSMCLQHKK